MAVIVVNICLFIGGIACLIYGIRAWNYKGPILMNKYLLASGEEKIHLKSISEMERKQDYRYVAKISFGLSAAWFLWLVSFVTEGAVSKCSWVLSFIVIALLLLFSLKELFQNNRS